mmetsp:Transcript_116598/g.226790  ORF Transcript_116598/g.226790 Transcript_116598/m.226790 type:complete len:235 (-) Transcript_116598:83-787(-)|eukprot:CAMPEP_0172717110 /NCGR_PEP_ID=MMETSP1074-20121228/70388_1 /TAXON_ID=2916 /ORGANISM="Ceratium fusus, Strain PA161109" /LENGTH=234 /DNA_ID=CAMNT_0013541969 /DNA_START=81 /DNA_END=785 /DNA_ORIENTATION=-
MGQTALQRKPYNCEAKLETCVVSLTRRAFDVEAPFGLIDEANCLLLNASKEGDVVGIRRAMEDGANINTRLPVWICVADPEDVDFEPPTGNHQEANRILEEPKAKGKGLTPLMHASHEGHAEAVKLLLSLRANLHLQDADGTQALHLAAQSTSADCFRTLLEAGADPLAEDQFGHDALHYVPLAMLACSPVKWEWLALLKEASGIPASIAKDDSAEEAKTDDVGPVVLPNSVDK